MSKRKRSDEGPLPPIIVRHGVPPDGGAGSEVVMFTIEAYDEYTEIATCHIEYRPNGISTVSDESETETIDVIDPAGCFFNEDAADLIGRWGTASYMQPIVDTDPYQTPVWVVIGLCCPE